MTCHLLALWSLSLKEVILQLWKMVPLVVVQARVVAMAAKAELKVRAQKQHKRLYVQQKKKVRLVQSLLFIF